jgi:alanine-synthesizing transaminase
MFVWAPLPARAQKLGQGAVAFATELLEKARVAVAPGVGFGPGGEGFVRFALVETDERARQACAAIGAYLRQTV